MRFGGEVRNRLDGSALRWRVVVLLALALLVVDVLAVWLSLDGLDSSRLTAAEVLSYVALGGGILLAAVVAEPNFVRDTPALGEKATSRWQFARSGSARPWRESGCPASVVVAVAVSVVVVFLLAAMGGPLFAGKGTIIDGRYYLMDHGLREVTRDEYREAAGGTPRFFAIMGALALATSALVGGFRYRSAAADRAAVGRPAQR